MVERMSRSKRRAQIAEIAAEEFAAHGLHGASTEAIAKKAGISQAYVFRIFGTKKALFLELIQEAFGRVTEGMQKSAGADTGLTALSEMGQQYYDSLADRTNLLLQLQGLAACGDPEIQDAVRQSFGDMWTAVAGTTGLDPVTVKTFLAYGMLLNSGAAMDVEALDEEWAEGIRTRIRPDLFRHITGETNQ